MKGKMRWLVYAVVITALITTVTLSRYMTNVSGTDTASAARIVLDGKGGGGSAVLDLSGLMPGKTKEITVIISNYKDEATSDVTQKYSMALETSGNLPVTYSLSAAPPADVQGNTVTPWSPAWSPKGDEKKVTSTKDGNLPGAYKSVHTYTLSVAWPAEKNEVRYSYEVDAVTLSVESEQTGK